MKENIIISYQSDDNLTFKNKENCQNYEKDFYILKNAEDLYLGCTLDFNESPCLTTKRHSRLNILNITEILNNVIYQHVINNDLLQYYSNVQPNGDISKDYKIISDLITELRNISENNYSLKIADKWKYLCTLLCQYKYSYFFPKEDIWVERYEPYKLLIRILHISFISGIEYPDQIWVSDEQGFEQYVKKFNK